MSCAECSCRDSPEQLDQESVENNQFFYNPKDVLIEGASDGNIIQCLRRSPPSLRLFRRWEQRRPAESFPRVMT
jgi:hypothetical protein